MLGATDLMNTANTLLTALRSSEGLGKLCLRSKNHALQWDPGKFKVISE